VITSVKFSVAIVAFVAIACAAAATAANAVSLTMVRRQVACCSAPG